MSTTPLLLLIDFVCVARICRTRLGRATMEARETGWPAANQTNSSLIYDFIAVELQRSLPQLDVDLWRQSSRKQEYTSLCHQSTPRDPLVHLA